MRSKLSRLGQLCTLYDVNRCDMRIVLKKAMGELSEEVFTGSYKSLI